MGMPVYHCDEYEMQPALVDPVVAPAETPREAGTLMGLCVDCKHRDNCSLSAREGGVWHCEEYC
jgi:hypothetical protein